MESEGYAELALPLCWPWDSWFCPLLDTAARQLAKTLMGELPPIPHPLLKAKSLDPDASGVGELAPPLLAC